MLTLFILDTHKPVLWQTVKMPRHGLHCLLRKATPFSGTEILKLRNLTCDPLRYKMHKSMLNVSICVMKSIRLKGVKQLINMSECLG